MADIEASQRFYERISPILRLRIRASRSPERFHVVAGDRSFALVRGEPSENVHMAFPVPERATVGEFHRIAVHGGMQTRWLST